MKRTASGGSCLDNWEDEQAEASRHETQFMTNTTITAKTKEDFLKLPGLLIIPKDPTPTPAPYHPASSSSCSEITSISGSNKEAGASFEPARARLPLTGSAVTSQSSFLDLSLSVSDAKDGDRASPDAEDDDGGGRGDMTEAVEKEHMFDKVVTPSDVGKLNRLVVPKQHAEKYFPLDAAASQKGLLLSFEDRTGKLWRFHYSFWNSSQSYVMTKGWSRFVRDKRLEAGDTISFYRRFGMASPRYIDYKRRIHRRHQCRLPGLLSPMQPVPLLVPFRSPTEMIPHAPMTQRPLAMPKLKLANANASSSPSVIRSYIKRLFQQLVQVRTIISSRGRVSMSNGLLDAVNYLASDARERLQDLHYLMLLAMLERNKKAGSDEASSSKTTPTGSSQFGYAENDEIHKITLILDKLIDGGLQLSGAASQDDHEMLFVSPLVSNCILLCRGILGITDVVGIDSMIEHQELRMSDCDDLTYSGDVNIARMNAQTIPTCVANPIYLLPTARRSLLYLDLSSCSDLMKLPASLGTLHNLSALNLSCCYSLYMLPESMGNLESLQILVLSFCCKLHSLPLSFGNLSKLRFLDLSGCFGLETLPDSFINLANLENLNLSDCKRLKGIPQPFGNLQKLMYLNLSGCNRLELQVEYMHGLANLKCLTLSPRTDVQGFPDSLGYLSYHLDLSRWWKKNWVHPNCKPKVASLHSYRLHEENIIGMLLSHCSDEGDVTSEQSVTSICIVGESGMGKTELVHRIYNDQMISDAFNLKIWICMCDKKRLLEKIIEFTTGTYCGEAPLSILEETVRDELIGKRFLLVLDDADIEDQCFWSDVLKLLNVGAEGSALIITTKSEVVDLLVGEMHTIYLNSLSKEESFMVFQEHAFGGFDMNNYQQLANIGCKVVEKCGGNPLCVKALSGLLCHCEVGLSEIGTLEGGIIPALRLCYDLLPAQLKQCFKFCSLFPKDYIFVKHYIVRLWISQGFIYPEEDSQPEDTALRYFNELFCRSFFQHSPFHNNQEDKFVMHELFHDLAHSVARDKCFRSEEPFCSLPENLCHLSLVLSDSKAVVLTKEVAHLQSLLVVRRSDTRCSSTSIPVLNILHLNDLFVKCRFLSVLNLSYVEIIELPTSIGNMKHLRFLALNNTKIKSLPSEIGQMEILQTLELKDCCNLIELPDSTKHLVKLRHLDVRKEQGNVHVGMPSGVRQLTDLQTLAIFNVGNDLLHCSIGDLKNLNGLRGQVHITGLENIKTGNDAREANLISKHFIEALTMEWCNNREDMENDLCEEIANQVLQNLQPNSSLQELVIRNYPGNSFPIWIQDSSLCKLVSVTIDDCQDCNELPSLGNLPYLKYLYIQRMNAVKRIGVESNSLATEGKHAPRFPSLEILNLWEMYGLQFWEGISDRDFPRLCCLSISRCPKLINLPPFMSLLYLSFHCGDQLPTFSGLPSLKSLKIAGFQKLKSITLSPEMFMLKKLEISDCKELLSVDDRWLTVSHLKVVRCPKLHFGGSYLEGCFTWEVLRRSAFGIHSQTKNTLLVKYMRAADHDGDGWNWTTYDQKDVLGSSFRRWYFRCSHKYQMGCMARKIAERNNDDPDTWSVTYISEHNHQQAVWLCTEPSTELSIQLGTCTEPSPEDIQLGTSKRQRDIQLGTSKRQRHISSEMARKIPDRWDDITESTITFFK